MLTDAHLHEHLRRRMKQRGVSIGEIEQVLNEGWQATDCKPGTNGRTFVFSYNKKWEGTFFEEKEVSVYYKGDLEQEFILLTAITRYGSGFPRRNDDENGI